MATMLLLPVLTITTAMALTAMAALTLTAETPQRQALQAVYPHCQLELGKRVSNAGKPYLLLNGVTHG